MPLPPSRKTAPAPLAPFWETTDGETVRLWNGDVVGVLEGLPEKSVHAIVTSPPYFALRDYGTGTWEGGEEGCDHEPPVEWLHSQFNAKSGLGGAKTQSAAAKTRYYKADGSCPRCGAVRVDDMQLGTEKLHDCLGWARGENCADREWKTGCFVCRMRAVFRGCGRVLRDDGVMWVNFGDSFSNGGGALPSGNMCGVPWRIALALQADGWVLRSDIPWVKRSCMPEPTSSRPAKSLEYVFMFVKNMGYYFDMESVRRPGKGGWSSDSFLPDSDKDKRDTSGRTATSSVSRANGSPDVVEAGTARNFRQTDLWFESVEGPHGLTCAGDELVGLDVTSQRYAGAHFACVDDQTEALTRTGWKRHTDLKDGDVIATYDRDGDVIVWGAATFHRYDYDGKLVAFDKRDTSQFLTPNHRCVVMSRKGVVKVREASTVKGGDRLMVSAPWTWNPDAQSIGTDMAALVGWYASEGHRKKDGRCAIYQSVTANAEKVEEIRGVLHRLGARFKTGYRTRPRYDGTGERSEAEFVIRGTVAERLRELVRGKGKNMVDALTDLNRAETEALLAAFIKGDGHTREDDGRMVVIQKDRRRIEQLQVMALKLGHQAILSERKSDGMFCLYLTEGRWLNVRGTNGKWDGHDLRDYRGVVWCPNTPTGFWLARRAGRPFVTGNTYPVRLIEPLIKCSTSEYGACADCGAPWERVVESDATGVCVESSQPKRVAHKPEWIPQSEIPHGRKMRTTGWQPRCTCHGEFVRRTVTVAKPVGGVPDHEKKNEVQGSLARSTLRTPVRYEDVEQVVTEYVPRIPPEDHPVVPCTVLDPFVGSGTTPATAVALGRRGWGIDLSATYLEKNAVPRVVGALSARPALAHLIPRRASVLSGLKKKKKKK